MSEDELKDFRGKTVVHMDIIQAWDIADGSISTGYPYLVFADLENGYVAIKEPEKGKECSVEKVLIRSKGEIVGNIITGKLNCHNSAVGQNDIKLMLTS